MMKVKCIRPSEDTGLRFGQIVEAEPLKKDPDKKWYIIKEADGREYAYPQKWFDKTDSEDK